MIEFPLAAYTLQIGATLFHFVVDGCTFVDCFVRCWSFSILYVLIYMLCFSSPTCTSSYIARTLLLLVKLHVFVSFTPLATSPNHVHLFVLSH